MIVLKYTFNTNSTTYYTVTRDQLITPFNITCYTFQFTDFYVIFGGEKGKKWKKRLMWEERDRKSLSLKKSVTSNVKHPAMKNVATLWNGWSMKGVKA